MEKTASVRLTPFSPSRLGRGLPAPRVVSGPSATTRNRQEPERRGALAPSSGGARAGSLSPRSAARSGAETVQSAGIANGKVKVLER